MIEDITHTNHNGSKRTDADCLHSEMGECREHWNGTSETVVIVARESEAVTDS